jgi:arylformamidase
MQFIDLTMTVNSNTPVYPGDRKPEFNQVAFTAKQGWNLHEFGLTTHTGTHLDAPWHMLPEGKRLTDFAVNRFIGSAVMFDVRGQSEIDVEMDGMRENDFLILRTDHSRHLAENTYFSGNPVVSRQMAEKILRGNFKMVGIDSYTLDNYPFDIHKLLLKQDILILENLVELDQLNTGNFKLMVFPLKLDKMDGAPCRAVAEID